MPIFDLKCSSCGFVFERFCKYDQAVAGIDCPECESMAYKSVSAPAYVYGDFYDRHARKVNQDVEKFEKKMGRTFGGGDASSR